MRHRASTLRSVLARRRRPARPGQALPLAALLLVGVLLVVGLAVDGGQLFLARRSLQATADAAAHAGAQQVDVAHFRATGQVRLDRAAATEAAAAVLREEGLADAEVAAAPDRVEVLARTRVPLLLMPAVRPGAGGAGGRGVRGRSTPALDRHPVGRPARVCHCAGRRRAS